MDNGDATSWLSVDETRRRLGLSRDAVYKRIKRGSLEARRGNDGAVRVLVASTTPMVAVRNMSTDASTTAIGQGVDTAELHDQLEEARERAAGALAATAEARERAARAEGELAAELRRSTDLLAVLAAERTSMAETLAAERARADRLEAALAQARKGWLERVLEVVRRK
jgi:hypothetical protein